MQPNHSSPVQNQVNQFAKRCLAEALLRLMEQKELDEINVSEICREAGFSRMAYYRNFSSKQDILCQYMRMLADNFRAEVIQNYPNHSSRSYEILLFAFRYFENYRLFTLRLMQAKLDSILQDGLNYYFETYITGSDSSPERRYAMYYYAGALFNLYTRWIKEGMPQSPEYMAELVSRIVNKGENQ